MIILQVQLGQTTTDQDVALRDRFSRFYNAPLGRIEYPVSCDSHAFDVYDDEFTTNDAAPGVDHAAVIELPYDYDAFTPFTEEDAGTELAVLGAEPGEGWVQP